ncbi:UNVERIFIED_CONTAM: hypothetical protein O8I53_13130 [Campylobacter lari]
MHSKLNNSELHFINDAGHTQRESGITRKLINFTNKIRNRNHGK